MSKPVSGNVGCQVRWPFRQAGLVYLPDEDACCPESNCFIALRVRRMAKGCSATGPQPVKIVRLNRRQGQSGGFHDGSMSICSKLRSSALMQPQAMRMRRETSCIRKAVGWHPALFGYIPDHNEVPNRISRARCKPLTSGGGRTGFNLQNGIAESGGGVPKISRQARTGLWAAVSKPSRNFRQEVSVGRSVGAGAVFPWEQSRLIRANENRQRLGIAATEANESRVRPQFGRESGAKGNGFTPRIGSG